MHIPGKNAVADSDVNAESFRRNVKCGSCLRCRPEELARCGCGRDLHDYSYIDSPGCLERIGDTHIEECDSHDVGMEAVAGRCSSNLIDGFILKAHWDSEFV